MNRRTVTLCDNSLGMEFKVYTITILLESLEDISFHPFQEYKPLLYLCLSSPSLSHPFFFFVDSFLFVT